jgi:hypothetical protein
MQDLRLRPVEQRLQYIKRHARQRVDAAGYAVAGQLQQAQLRTVGAFAQEFRVEGNGWRLAQERGDFSQTRAIGDDLEAHVECDGLLAPSRP